MGDGTRRSTRRMGENKWWTDGYQSIGRQNLQSKYQTASHALLNREGGSKKSNNAIQLFMAEQIKKEQSTQNCMF